MERKKTTKVKSIPKKAENSISTQSCQPCQPISKIPVEESVASKAPISQLAAPIAAPKKDEITIEFTLQAPNAQTVAVAGDFNEWLMDQDKMAKGKDGVWRKKVKLAPGKHEYQFVVDGRWWTDPDNLNRTSNPFGTQNSVKVV
ncbi:MAG: glycogen-binding domain-containing protein [Pseudomonadota bacterium]